MAALVIGLSGCASPGAVATSSPPATSTSTATPGQIASPTPTASEEPAQASVASVVVLPTHVEFRDAAGGVAASFDYATEAEAAILAFRDLLGAETYTDEDDGSYHYPPSTLYAWGDIEIIESHFVDMWADHAGNYSYDRPSFMLIIGTAEQQGIAFSSGVGVIPGDDWAVAASSAIDSGSRFTCTGTPIDSIELGEVEQPDGTTFIQTVTTAIVNESYDPSTNTWTATDVVSEVRAPVMLVDGCV
ncbi:hypothetical protein [Agromyces atrinae]|uniref:Uncharacterized protein n=1 Tax=Agromyces atrinae TaxID=592376 RepID=A0A4Q2M6W6_9MICO|nr:hypothetical protein [Agromyces atrinae]NYD65772.1 hypothetical protein [Agromyces atrinae]RXZ85562.1 hypothetical protein ESP50_15300 [Agromyces atrinae]